MKLLNCGISSNREITLTPLDVRAGFASVRKFLVFDGSLDLARFEQALSKSLALFPIYCGRAYQSNQVYSIRLCDSGILFEIEYRQENLLCSLPLPTFPNSQGLTPKISMQPVNTGKPLFGIKITIFQNAFVVGVSSSHVLGDGTASWLFLQTLSAIYSNRPVLTSPNHDRDSFYNSSVSLSAASETPVKIPIMSRSRQLLFIAQCIFADVVGKNITYEIKYTDINRFNHAELMLSDQDYILAMVARDVAAVSANQSLTVGSVYSIRRFPQFGIDESYVGNAICARTTTQPKTAWIENPQASIAALRQTTNKLTHESVAAEYRFFKQQSENGSLARLLPDFIACLFNGGILMNNCTKFPMYSCQFDDNPPLWVYTHPPGLPRYASIFPNRTGDGVVVHLKMPRREIARLLAISPARRSFRKYIIN